VRLLLSIASPKGVICAFRKDTCASTIYGKGRSTQWPMHAIHNASYGAIEQPGLQPKICEHVITYRVAGQPRAVV
jgi:hypothetical protein